MSDELMPCPFCGRQPFFYEDSNHSTAWNICCPSNNDGTDLECFVGPSVWGVTREAATEQWNRRAPVAALSLAESRGREIGREEAAKIAEDMLEVIPMWDRPGGPPGNGPKRPATPSEIAAAIRNLPTNEAGE